MHDVVGVEDKIHLARKPLFWNVDGPDVASQDRQQIRVLSQAMARPPMQRGADLMECRGGWPRWAGVGPGQA